MLSPSDEYLHRQSNCEALTARCAAQHARIGQARLLIAAVTIVTVWLALAAHLIGPAWVLIPIAAFIGLVLYHFVVRREGLRSERASAFYRAGLTRLQDRWAGTGQQGGRFDDPHHPYAGDLDLFGRGGLFELLCGARTRMGENCLARWLLSQTSLAQIHERQTSVAELRDRLDLREGLAVLGAGGDVGVPPQELLDWSRAPDGLQARWLYPVCGLLIGLAAAAAMYWALAGVRAPFLFVLLLQIGLLYSIRKRIDSVLKGVENAFEDLRLFAAILARMEQESFGTPALQALQSRLSAQTLPASRAVARLGTIANLAGSRRNQIVAALSVPLLYSVQVAIAAERWRARHGSDVGTWLDTIGEFEALMSLAGYSYEHPADPFPQFVDGAATFIGAGLGHPLIPESRCVRNDVDISGATRVLLVSGSNMSGKSTLLRTVGINAVLAMAGAPVRATRLQLTPLRVGASIRINDSLHEGSSRFYAEITRLRELFVLAGHGEPLLFLLDELLQGTNSHDRKIGAEGIIRAFVARGSVGLISTHDLALTQITGLAAGALRNVHFQDEFENGRMKFDFRLRDGVVTKSNGVELMRSVGLDV